MKQLSQDPRPSSVARTVLGLLTLGTILGALGCGETVVVTRVNVVSFLGPAETNPSYGANPPIPPGIPAVTIPVGPSTVMVPAGLGDIAEVIEADVSVRAIVVNETGTGRLDLRIFLARPGEDPFAGQPAAVFTVSLIPAAATIIEDTVELTEEAQALFEDSEIQFAYELLVDGSQSTDPMAGTILLEKLRIRVVHDPSF